MALYIPVNRKTKLEYAPIEANDLKDAELKWNTVSIGHVGKYDFKLVVEKVVKPKTEKKAKDENIDEWN
jgi:hypothetical protein